MGCCFPKDAKNRADLEGQLEQAAGAGSREQNQPMIENSAQPASPNT